MTTPAGMTLPTPTLTQSELVAWAMGYLAGYDRGHEDGVAEGYERYDRHLIDAAIRMLGGEHATDWRDAVRRHERAAAQLAARRAAPDAPRRDAA